MSNLKKQPVKNESFGSILTISFKKLMLYSFYYLMR